MAERKYSLLEKFVNSLKTDMDEEPKKSSRVSRKRPTKSKKPAPDMLGTGLAGRAGRALSGRGRQIDSAVDDALVGR